MFNFFRRLFSTRFDNFSTFLFHCLLTMPCSPPDFMGYHSHFPFQFLWPLLDLILCSYLLLRYLRPDLCRGLYLRLNLLINANLAINVSFLISSTTSKQWMRWPLLVFYRGVLSKWEPRFIRVNLSIFFGKHLLSVPSSQNRKAFPFLSALPKVDSNPFHVLSLSKILKEISKTFPTTNFFGKKK